MSTVNLTGIKVLSENNYSDLPTTPENILHFVELPLESYITEAYRNGTEGYLIYSNGLIIQWGRLTRSATGVLSVSFYEDMMDASYISLITMVGADSYNTSATNNPCYVTQKRYNGMNIVGPAAIANIGYADWIVIGY